METASHYALLDSGDGRKLERFGPYVLARPCSQAIWRPSLPGSAWEAASAAFDREKGLNWHGRERLPGEWTIAVDGITFRLSSTDFGHLGIFPEQRDSWRWIDAAQGMVEWARRNAELNGLKAWPIRWIVDDAHKFLAREVKRGRRYDGIVLDPPSFGRGARGEVYKLERDLPATLALCRRVLSDRPAFVLLSAHTPGVTQTVLRHLLEDAFGDLRGTVEDGEMFLRGAEGVRPVPSGCMARWSSRA